MTPGGEELGYAGGVEASFGQTESRSQTGAACTDNNCIVLVVENRVLVINKWLCLLGAERSIGDDSSSMYRGRERTSLWPS